MKHLSPPIAKFGPKTGPERPPSKASRPLEAREARQILRQHGETYAPGDVEQGLTAARQLLRLLIEPSKA